MYMQLLMQWIVNPQNGNGPQVCTGRFVTTKPF